MSESKPSALETSLDTLLETLTKLQAKNKFKMPTKVANAADMLYATRERRLAIQRTVDFLADQENQLREYLIKNLPKGEASGVSGKVASVSIGLKTIPQVENWDSLYTYIKKTGSFELLQRRLSETAVKERWADKKSIPGVVSFNAVSVSCTKNK